jgi:hypothetical protein
MPEDINPFDDNQQEEKENIKSILKSSTSDLVPKPPKSLRFKMTPVAETPQKSKAVDERVILLTGPRRVQRKKTKAELLMQEVSNTPVSGTPKKTESSHRVAINLGMLLLESRKTPSKFSLELE